MAAHSGISHPCSGLKPPAMPQLFYKQLCNFFYCFGKRCCVRDSGIRYLGETGSRGKSCSFSPHVRERNPRNARQLQRGSCSGDQQKELERQTVGSSITSPQRAAPGTAGRVCSEFWKGYEHLQFMTAVRKDPSP